MGEPCGEELPKVKQKVTRRRGVLLIKPQRKGTIIWFCMRDDDDDATRVSNVKVEETLLFLWIALGLREKDVFQAPFTWKMERLLSQDSVKATLFLSLSVSVDN